MNLPYLLVKKIQFDSLLEENAVLKKEINRAAEFIKKIENGELDIAHDIQANEQSELAFALQSMQQQLKKIAEEEKQRNWATEGLAKFVDILRSNDQNLEQLAESIISSLVKYINANQGALFVVRGDEQNVYLEMLSCYAYGRKKHLHKTIIPGEGLVGQCYLEADTILITELPENYIQITSGLGEATPRAAVIVPLKINGVIFGVLELASFHKFEKYRIDFLEKLGESIASTISSAETNIKTKKLLEESQEQAEMMRAQEEEMRQNMEELTATQEEMIRKQSELEALQKDTEKQKLQTDSLMNNLPGIVYRCLFDQNFTSLFISQKSEVFTGYTANSFTDGSVRLGDIIHPEDQQRVKEEIRRDVSEKGHFESRYRIIHKNGTEKWVWDSGSVIKNSTGTIEYIEGLILDISSQVKSEELNKTMALEVKANNEQLKARELELRQNMEELKATQEELIKKSEELENISQIERDRAQNQINSQKKIMEAVVSKFKLQEQELKEKIAELEGLKK